MPRENTASFQRGLRKSQVQTGNWAVFPNGLHQQSGTQPRPSALGLWTAAQLARGARPSTANPTPRPGVRECGQRPWCYGGLKHTTTTATDPKLSQELKLQTSKESSIIHFRPQETFGGAKAAPGWVLQGTTLWGCMGQKPSGGCSEGSVRVILELPGKRDRLWGEHREPQGPPEDT